MCARPAGLVRLVRLTRTEFPARERLTEIGPLLHHVHIQVHIQQRDDRTVHVEASGNTLACSSSSTPPWQTCLKENLLISRLPLRTPLYHELHDRASLHELDVSNGTAAAWSSMSSCAAACEALCYTDLWLWFCRYSQRPSFRQRADSRAFRRRLYQLKSRLIDQGQAQYVYPTSAAAPGQQTRGSDEPLE